MPQEALAFLRQDQEAWGNQWMRHRTQLTKWWPTTHLLRVERPIQDRQWRSSSDTNPQRREFLRNLPRFSMPWTPRLKSGFRPYVTLIILKSGKQNQQKRRARSVYLRVRTYPLWIQGISCQIKSRQRTLCIFNRKLLVILEGMNAKETIKLI